MTLNVQGSCPLNGGGAWAASQITSSMSSRSTARGEQERMDRRVRIASTVFIIGPPRPNTEASRLPCGENVAKFREGATWTSRSRSTWLGKPTAGIHLLDGLRKASWRGLESDRIENSVPKTECGTNVGPTRRPFPFSGERSGRSYRKTVPQRGFDWPPASRSALGRCTWPDRWPSIPGGPFDEWLSNAPPWPSC